VRTKQCVRTTHAPVYYSQIQIDNTNKRRDKIRVSTWDTSSY